MKYLLPLILFFLSAGLLPGQNDFDVNQSVKMTATTTANQTTVTWISDPGTTSYDLYRRTDGAGQWQLLLENLSPQDTSYADDQSLPGQTTEYRVDKFTTEGVDGFGYVLAGFARRAVHHQGYLLVVLSAATELQIANDLNAYLEVLESDGWTVQTLTVDASGSSASVKEAMLARRPGFPYTAVLLLDDVPIAFSGDINPDAHADHKGAWASDVFYGDLDGHWTDSIVNNSSAATPVNHNVPGDGKWDQSFLPSDVEVAVGRVDFRNLPFFATDRYELLRNYLRKNIAYRTKGFTPVLRAAMRNHNPWTGALGQNGIRNFSPLVGPDSISYDTWDEVFTDSYLWYYGAGGSNVRNPQSWVFAVADFRAVFTLWFSSYVGDYGLENNFMKASLASGDVLTAGWAGAPHWHLHRMALGETIGDAALLTQNNDTTYTADYFPRGVHINLLGDPTLKSYVAAPPHSLLADELADRTILTWSDDNTTGRSYFVYRRPAATTEYELLNNEALTEPEYSDTTRLSSVSYDYLVRAQELETTPSGSFYNLSAGIKTSTSTTAVDDNTYRAGFEVYPNPASNWLRIRSDQPVTELFLRDASGRTVLRQSTSNTTQLQVALPRLAGGIYFLQAILEDGRMVSSKLTVR